MNTSSQSAKSPVDKATFEQLSAQSTKTPNGNGDSSGKTAFEDWREIEKILDDILVSPGKNDDNDGAKELKAEDVRQYTACNEGNNFFLEESTYVSKERGIAGPHEKWRQGIAPVHQNESSNLSSLILDQRINGTHERVQEKRKGMEDEIEALTKKKEDNLARAKLNNMLRPLEVGEKKRVQNLLYGKGLQHEIIAEIDSDTVTRQSVQRLRPGVWLNDEIIHFYFAALSRRDSEHNPTKRCHFFKSFFLTKLLEEQNGYKYSNVKRWSKKVSGKDVFALDKMFFPVNIGNAHWATSVIFMQEKCIRFYDSMGGNGTRYSEALLRYLKDEWKDKKKTNREDWDEWKLAGHTDDIPQQHNGYDCGVFTCVFADFLSRDMPLCFAQQHVASFRNYITLSILNGKVQ